MSINKLHLKEKLNKINLAIRQLAENEYKQPKAKVIEQLLQLKEAQDFLNTTSKEPKGNRPYTEEESEAVGTRILPELEKAIRAKKGELASKPTVTGEVNGFLVHTVYGHNKGEDHFKFTLDPKTGTLYYKEGTDRKLVSTFEVTQANEVTLDSAVDLQNRLEILLTKYPSSTVDNNYVTGITKDDLQELMLEAYVEVLREQEEEEQIPQIPEVPTEPVTPAPEKKPIPKVVKNELAKVIDSLFGSSHMDFVDKIQLAVPNPSEFQVFLKNGQSFYLKWMGKSPQETAEEAGIEHLGQEVKGAFMAEIESKKYYLGSLPQYEQALDKLGELLKNGILTQGAVPGEAAFGEPTGGESTGGGGSAGAGSEAGIGGETFPEVPEEAPTNAAGTGPEETPSFEEEPTAAL